ncbi:hypothetical protein LCGC14_2677440 [marine sediment metagenome]|uniref:Uncharacterized protein n=1 Tax=marine sediment metagenome TaxID=412755 RepID=A0A0F9CE56_9ZZZZ
MTDTIKININDINAVEFHKQVIQTVPKQITSFPYYNMDTKLVETVKLEYGIKFMVGGTPLKQVLNQATKNSKTDIGNDLRANIKKDIYANYKDKILVDVPCNDTFDFFNTLLNDENILVVNGFPTGLPTTPETPEQKHRTGVALFDTMDKSDQKTYLADLQKRIDKK